MEMSDWSRRKFLTRTVAFSAAAMLTGCKHPTSPAGADAITSDGVHVLAVGDWGQYGIGGDYRAQAAVAAGMREYVHSHRLQASALLLLGDNFYGPLQGGVHSPRWESQFETMYPASAFACPAYAVPGNHDYQRWPAEVSKFEAELAYAQTARDTRWRMPGLPYSFALPANNPIITLIAFDSNMPNEPAQPVPLPADNSYTLTDIQRKAQLVRLEEMLAAPAATPFVAMMGHHPLYSDGAHGDNHTLIRDISPLLNKHSVHLYLAGHDHDLQHLEMESHPTSFVLSGGGGADLYDVHLDRHKGFAQKVHGFTHLQVHQDRIIVRHIDGNGAVLHAFTKMPDGKVIVAT